MTAGGLRVGWCPGALRPMESGDGLIVRVKPRGATLTLSQAGAIAALADRFGNGNLELTGRANLQIRGLPEDGLEPLWAGLRQAGLLDATSDAEAVRNVVSSPLQGLDPDAVSDIRPTVAALEERLADDVDLHRLPAKWSFVVDDGGRFALAGVIADLRFEAVPGGFTVGLADDPARAFCRTGRVADVAAALCREALNPEPKRMAGLLAQRKAAEIFAAIGLELVQDGIVAGGSAQSRGPIGSHLLGGDAIVLGLGAPFGCLAAEDLASLTKACLALGASDLRLTPWRALFIAGLDAPSADRLSEVARRHGFIVDPADPRLVIAACIGAPACRRGTTPARLQAAALAERIVESGAGIQIHVSGCSKGCAHPDLAPWTLVGRDGLYDLVRDGRPGGVPFMQGLSFQDAASWLCREANLERH